MIILGTNDQGQNIVVNRKGIVVNQSTGNVEDNPFVSADSNGKKARVYNFSKEEIKAATNDDRTKENKLKEWNQLSRTAVLNGLWNDDDVERHKKAIQNGKTDIDDEINFLLEESNKRSEEARTGKEKDSFKVNSNVANYDKDYKTWVDLAKKAQELGYWNDSEIDNCKDRINTGSNNLERSIAKLNEVIDKMTGAKTTKTDELDKVEAEEKQKAADEAKAKADAYAKEQEEAKAKTNTSSTSSEQNLNDKRNEAMNQLAILDKNNVNNVLTDKMKKVMYLASEEQIDAITSTIKSLTKGDVDSSGYIPIDKAKSINEIANTLKSFNDYIYWNVDSREKDALIAQIKSGSIKTKSDLESAKNALFEKRLAEDKKKQEEEMKKPLS